MKEEKNDYQPLIYILFIAFMIVSPLTLIYLFGAVGIFLCLALLGLNFLISSFTPMVHCACGNTMRYDESYTIFFFHKLFQHVMCTSCGKYQRVFLNTFQKIITCVNLFIFIIFIKKLIF